MGFPKQLKDTVYRVLQEPTLENFRKTMQDGTGEHNYIDFKEQWIEKSKLAKEILAIANSGGGLLVFGVKELPDKTFSYDGLSELKAKEDISNELKGYISSNLRYDVFDFSFDSSEYQALIGKKYQMMLIEDTPQHLPFMSRKEGENVKPNTVYVRRGTSCEMANEEELRNLIERKVHHDYPVRGEPLKLKEHLEQLQELYIHIDATKTRRIYDENSNASNMWSVLLSMAKGVDSWFGKTEVVPNPLYPEEDYEHFIARMISEKKKKIERVLDLR